MTRWWNYGDAMKQWLSNRNRLSAREEQVVALIENGCTNREIGERLGISPTTVKRHLTNIYDKVGVSSRLELGVWKAQRDDSLRSEYLQTQVDLLAVNPNEAHCVCGAAFVASMSSAK